jgi:hypothetical protein
VDARAVGEPIFLGKNTALKPQTLWSRFINGKGK